MAINLPPIGALQQRGIVPQAPQSRGRVLAAGAPPVSGNSLGRGLAGLGQGMAAIGQMVEQSRQQKNRKAAVERMLGIGTEARNAAMAAGGGPTPQAAAAMQSSPIQSMGIPPQAQELLRGLYDAGEYDAAFNVMSKFALASPEQAKPVVVGNALVDPTTGQPIYKGEEAAPATLQEYRLAKKDGLIPEGMSYADFKTIGRGGTTVNVNTGQQSEQWGKPDSGYVWARNTSGEVATETLPDGTVRPRQVPIAGGKTDLEQAAGAEAAAIKQSGKDVQFSVIEQDINRALSSIESGIELPVVGNTQTGLIGALLSKVPGTPQHTLGNMLSTVKANVGFEKLQAMRDASPTGGALGNVSEQENRLLQSVLGSLEQSNNDAELSFNLMRLREVLANIIHGPPELRMRNEVNQPSIDDLLKKYGG